MINIEAVPLFSHPCFPQIFPDFNNPRSPSPQLLAKPIHSINRLDIYHPIFTCKTGHELMPIAPHAFPFLRAEIYYAMAFKHLEIIFRVGFWARAVIIFCRHHIVQSDYHLFSARVGSLSCLVLKCWVSFFNPTYPSFQLAD